MALEAQSPVPRISVVMPVRNEGAYLPASFEALDAQTLSADAFEILVVDGGSTDDTVALVTERAATDPRIRVFGGPGVNTPAAMNLGTDVARGEYVAKVDGHGWVNEGFLATALQVMDRDPGVGCVGGRIVPVATTKVQHAIELARFSKLGVGAGIYTAPDVVHDIDTVQCGVYRKSVLDAIGGFDPDMPYGEDEEVNHRVRGTGARIVFDPAMRFHYHVRPTLKALLRQYWNYGRARVRVVRKHPDFLRPKHLVPAVLVVTLAGGAVFGILVDPRIAVVVGGGYVVALLIGGVALSARSGFRRPDLVAAALGCLHLGYGAGSLAGLGDLLRPRG